MELITEIADIITSGYTTAEMSAEMTSTNADHCFLETEADTIYFASVFVQPPIHSYFQSYIGRSRNLRSNKKTHFTHQAEVANRTPGQTLTRSDFIYYAEKAEDFAAQVKANYQGNPRVQDINPKLDVCFIVEYKRAHRIDYVKFSQIASNDGTPISIHVKRFIAQCAAYAKQAQCKWVGLTDMCGFIIIHFPGMTSKGPGTSCEIFVTADRNEIRRCWLGGLVAG